MQAVAGQIDPQQFDALRVQHLFDLSRALFVHA